MNKTQTPYPNEKKVGIYISTEHKVIGGIGLLSLIILIGGVWLMTAKDASEEASLLGEKIDNMGATHISRGGTITVDYNSNPPTSGPHWGDGTAGPGIKDQEVPDQLLIHSLEHGAVILSYKGNLPKEDIEEIKNYFNESAGKKIMVPRKNLDVPVALTSWNRLLKLTTIDGSKIKEFIEANSDRAPEKAPI